MSPSVEPGARPRRILVIANETCAAPGVVEEVRYRAGEGSEVVVVAPALARTRLEHWLTSDLEARQEDARRYGRGALDIFPDRDFGGNAIRFERDTERLGRRSDNAASMIVHQGVWELCTEPRFEGRCRVFEPGRYASLGRLDDRVASLRQLR